MADDYRAVLEHFDVEDAILVGHSMGAFLTIALCLEHTAVVAKRVRGLVLVGGHAGGVAKSSPQNRLHAFFLKRGWMDRAMRVPPVGRAIARSLFGKDAPYVFVEAARTMMLDNVVGPTLSILNAMLDEDHYARIGAIPVPARVICGRLDRTCPPFHSERLGAEIKGSKTIWLGGVGHMVNYEQPRVFVEQIAALSPPPRAVVVEQRVA
jgi:non-heme chloroperoxidase